jgi:hypothetical protein
MKRYCINSIYIYKYLHCIIRIIFLFISFFPFFLFLILAFSLQFLLGSLFEFTFCFFQLAFLTEDKFCSYIIFILLLLRMFVWDRCLSAWGFIFWLNTYICFDPLAGSLCSFGLFLFNLFFFLKILPGILLLFYFFK